MSLFVAYFGAEGNWKDTAHHTILLGPRYKELLHDIFRKKVLADDFLSLPAPSSMDRHKPRPSRWRRLLRPFASTESEEWY